MSATKEQLQALLERVEKATGPDRSVDCHLWVLSKGGDARMKYCDPDSKEFVWEQGIDGFWIREVRSFGQTPKFTASIDAALALVERVLPGAMRRVFDDATGDGATADIMAPEVVGHGKAETWPLAILAALLKALIAQADEVQE